MNERLAPGSIIGIIGGGQLGRMLAQSASALGYRTHIFTPEENSPAADVTNATTIADYADRQALQRFANAVDVVTFEFENIPAESLALLEKEVFVAPGPSILAVSQNRVREKNYISSLGISTTPFVAVASLPELQKAAQQLGYPSILKTAEMGYDGKGQVKLQSDANLAGAWQVLGGGEAVLEAFADFGLEISVIVARNRAGQTAIYEPAHNQHLNHILDTTHLPAPITARQAEAAQEIAIRLAEAFQLVGLLAVELFVMKNGEIWVNEIAPRPHNSGHWTMDAACTSQFEQHIRAICNWPLGSAKRHHAVTMQNLIGDAVNDWPRYAAIPNARLHLYGKKTVRAGRKMGHVNLLEKFVQA